MTEEHRLVELFPLRGLNYVRESDGPTPNGAFPVAYTIDASGYIRREWFLFYDAFVDGVELEPAFDQTRKVRVDSLLCNKPTVPWDERLAIACTKKPVRYRQRWAEYFAEYNPRITDSLWTRFLRWLNGR